MTSFLEEVSLGLSKKNKKLSSKWFYDFRGSKLFEQIYFTTNFQGTFSTFTAAGHVRRGLSNSGFSVSKVVGFGNKKESLIGIKKTLSSEINKVTSKISSRELEQMMLSLIHI